MRGFNKLLSGTTLIVLSSVSLVAILIIADSQPAQAAVWINDSNIFIGNKGHESLGTSNKNFRVCNYDVTANHRYESSRWQDWPDEYTYSASRRYRSTVSSWISPKDDPTSPPQRTIGEEKNEVNLRMNVIGHYCTANMFDASGHDPENYQDNYNWDAVFLDKQMVKETWLNIEDEVTVDRYPSAPASCNDDPGDTLYADSRIEGQRLKLDWDPAWGNSPKPFYVKPNGGDGQPLHKDFGIKGFQGLPPGCYTIRIDVETKSTTQKASNGDWVCSKNGAPAIPSGDDCPVLTYRFRVTVNISESQQEIRGYKVAEGGVQQSDIEHNRVDMDGGNLSTTSNPFRFESVSPGDHSVSVETGGYNVRYEYCRNQNVPDCDPGSLETGNGNSFTATVPEGGFVDVRFYFREDSGPGGSSAIRGKKVDGNHDSSSSEPWYNNLVTVDGGPVFRSSISNPFSFTSLPVRTYTVSVANEPDYEVRWIYCRSVGSGSGQTVNFVRDDGSCEFDNGSRRSGTGSSFNVQTNPDEQVYVHFIFEEIREAELETNTKGNHRVAIPGDSVSVGAYVKNTGDAESEPVTLRVRAVSGSNRISPNFDQENVGTLEPGDREDRSFSFNVSGNAQDGDKICFKSRAKESGKSWVNGNRQVCVGVVRNFDMRTRVYAPNSPEDELTGPFRVTGVARNHRNRNQDGMKTQGHNYIEVSLSVESGKQYVKHLYNGSSDKAGSPTRTQPYKLTWEYSGFGAEFFHAQPTPDHDKVRAWTEVKKDAVEGIKEVCFKVKAKPRYRHKNIFQSYSGWGSIDTYGSYSRTDCTDLWEVRAPYVTTEDGDVHGGSVVVNPETADQQCQNDNVDVEGRTTSGSTIGSKSTYAVSATGRINNFGSNNSTNDGRLKFGNQPPSGDYQAICRPDLTNLNYYKKLGYDITRDNTRNIRSIINRINNEAGKYSDGDEFVVRLTHPNPRVQGNNVTLERGKRVTFIAKNRDFDIRSDVRMEGGSRNNVNDIPALAIIAGGDIDIYRDVGNIQAYISSNGTVDTCGNVANITQQNQAPKCEDWLRIRGALIAKRIEFRRTSGDAGHSGPAEVIVYAPELSLSPPPGTMGLTNNIFFGRPLWERLPFF